jgi:hypothetical protein
MVSRIEGIGPRIGRFRPWQMSRLEFPMVHVQKIRDKFRHLTGAQLDLIEEILGQYTSDDLVINLNYLDSEREHYEKAVERLNRASDEVIKFSQDVQKAEQQVFNDCLEIAHEVIDEHTVVRDLRTLVRTFDTE